MFTHPSFESIFSISLMLMENSDQFSVVEGTIIGIIALALLIFGILTAYFGKGKARAAGGGMIAGAVRVFVSITPSIFLICSTTIFPNSL